MSNPFSSDDGKSWNLTTIMQLLHCNKTEENHMVATVWKFHLNYFEMMPGNKT